MDDFRISVGNNQSSYSNQNNSNTKEESIQVNIDENMKIQIIDNNEIIQEKTKIEENTINIKIDHRKLVTPYPLERLLFLFINPKSGSEEGKIILKLVEEHNNFNSGEEKLIKFEDKCEEFYTYIFNIIDSSDYKLGCMLLTNYINFYSEQNENNKIKLLIGGGDGTVLSIIEDLNSKHISISNCVFGHLPLGTGNDLSNALGFGNVVNINDKLSSIIKILIPYHRALIDKVDVWELRLSVDKEKGEVIQVNKENKISLTDWEGNYITNFKRSFINYFSLGYDARVGFGFDKSRCGNRCCNKFIYFWEGCKKNCCRKTIPLNSFIDSFHIVEEGNRLFNTNYEEFNEELSINNDQNYFQEGSPENTNILYEKQRTKVLFTSKLWKKDNLDKHYNEILLKGNPVNLVCQNINFYMGGTKDIWRKSGNSIGVEVYEGINPSKNETDNLKVMLLNSEQKFNDQKLEFFTYSSGFKVGFEKIVPGQADKVYHGYGPVLVKFKDTPERNKLDKFNRVYLNVDGEYFHIVKPIDLRIRLNRKICNGSVNFLINSRTT